ncbi:MAG: hypothetical protein AB8B64_26650 [Granulosicoccus sp.]
MHSFQRKKLERLCHYISRPAITEQRLSLNPMATSATHSKRRVVMAPGRAGSLPWCFCAQAAPPSNKHRAVLTKAKRRKSKQADIVEPFHSTRHLAIYCEIGIVFTVNIFINR